MFISRLIARKKVKDMPDPRAPNSKPAKPYVISASRRTDLPAFYAGWLRECLERCEATFLSPRGGWRTVSLVPCRVHSIVLCSKNYGPVLDDPRLLRLLPAYNPYFHFTITGLGGTDWEPKVPPTDETLKQTDRLVARFGPERIGWRLDPMVFWPDQSRKSPSVAEADQSRWQSNLEAFVPLAGRMADLGIKRCTLSFARWYDKAVRRTRNAGKSWSEPDMETRQSILKDLAGTAKSLGIELFMCADPSEVPDGIRHGSCIDGPYLTKLHPERLPAASGKDRSQRQACGCTHSIDIGSYRMACGHGCLYCYANPSAKVLDANLAAHMEAGK